MPDKKKKPIAKGKTEVRQKLKVVLCWHMHQPQYKNMASGTYHLPWTYLHATKDYVDMAALLEDNPKARAVINFAPILLEQISDYAGQLDAALSEGHTVSDPLLAALASPTLPMHKEERLLLVSQCLRVNEERLINRFPHYKRLAKIGRMLEADIELMHYLDDRFLVDILCWYHLAWLGETVHRTDKRVQYLVEKGCDFALHDRIEIVTIIAELLKTVIARYRKLAESGQIEISMNPYAHPIMPLLLDMQSARESWADIVMPACEHYPGGKHRAAWHMEYGIKEFKKHFGFAPVGCWPSEGALNTATLELMDKYGIKWAASGEGVLRGSLASEERLEEVETSHALYKPYRAGKSKAAAFFRDDGLSDLIGFTYSSWHGDDAAADMAKHLRNIAASCEHKGKQVVSIILDGENAWEHYPHNGYYFLSALYRELSNHPDLELTTFTDALNDVDIGQLDNIVTGSWVYGTLSTWIGDKDKNYGWEMLAEAKNNYDKVIASGKLSKAQRTRAEQQLALCEGSDWFWWFGDYNPADSVSDFEFLFRMHLTNLYAVLGVEPPEYLSHIMAHGSGAPEHGGAMRRGSGS